MTTCSMTDCLRPVRSHGLCGAHEMRRRRNAESDRPVDTTPERQDWIRLQIENPGTGCRDWPWSTGEGIYPKLGHRYVSHVVLEASGRPRPEAPHNLALHACDRPCCCAPWHLRWGSVAENSADSVARGQQPRGSRNGRSRLNEVAVADIRTRVSQGARQKDLAVQYGVSKATISEVVSGRYWLHVTVVR